MITWTRAAREALERHLETVRRNATGMGADGDEVAEDVRRHLEAEVGASGLTVVTAPELEKLLARLGGPEADEPTVVRGPDPDPAVGPPTHNQPPWWLLLAGILLPLITLTLEWTTGMCAGAFFDPIPTPLHTVLVLLVPVTNAWTWRVLARGGTRSPRLLALANGIAIGVAAYYAILFLPLLLPGLVGVLYGIGLLPWSPMLALIASVAIRRRLRRLDGATGRPLPGLWAGFAVAISMLALVEAPVWLTRLGMESAAAEDPARQERGLKWLRRLGHEQTLLRACYGRTRGAAQMDLFGLFLSGGRDVGPEKAREIFYRVTGHPFNTVPAPKVRTGRGAFTELSDWTWDNDQGGERVGGRVEGLTLHSSRLDEIIEPDAAWSYTEWTLEFRNAAQRAREARAQILLPPGGVVSRLTLWVNGEEREAAFAGRAAVRQAYQEVAIRRRRDPVLVTTCGPDRVLVQCFPVPPEGGVMRVRLGITAPLELQTVSEAAARWPCFVERNFTIPSSFQHSLWAECRGALEFLGSGLTSERPKPGMSAVRGRMTDPELARAAGALRVRRDPAARVAWAANPRQENGGFVRQTVVEERVAAPDRVVFALDGSSGMVAALGEFAAALDRLPDGLEVAAVYAVDEAMARCGPGPFRAVRAELSRQLATLRPGGGQDNVPALVSAWEIAAEKPGSVVVWVHGPQPVALSSAEALRQAYDRRPNGPSVVEIATEPSPNRILEELDRVESLRRFPRLGSLGEDLRRLFDTWHGSATRVVLRRESTSNEPAAKADAACDGGLHLVRLWARDAAERLRRERKPEEAVRLAGAYQIVTPLSGAVVLETQAQYAQHNLEPAPADTVPSIPEPATWALFAAGIALFLTLRRGNRRRQAHVRP